MTALSGTARLHEIRQHVAVPDSVVAKAAHSTTNAQAQPTSVFRTRDGDYHKIETEPLI